MAAEDNIGSSEKFWSKAKEELNIGPKKLLGYAEALSFYSLEISKTFTQGRQRISELSTTLADAAPRIASLGGEMEDVSKIIGTIAQESRRNVTANIEDVESLYAAQRVLELGAGELTKNFLDVGRGIETIPDTLNESVKYIQSIGGNAKTVMKDVVDKMSYMNRFQFEGGVLGLTKMAAQASIMRFDMKETFNLAEKVLDPEGAIEVASAFQRLGVASGNLVDPFQLMNQSINDPSGLQESLASVSKQFTYFDEKTKTFKINPQGVLTLRQMEKEANLTAGSLSKMGLAVAEIDKRMSDVNMAGLQFENEEDKQYLSNIAKMGKGGKYEVELKDGTKKELRQLNQEEFDKLIDEQKKGPDTLEKLAREQMVLSERAYSDLAAIKAKIVGGFLSAPKVLETGQGIYGGVSTFTEGLSKSFDIKTIRGKVDDALGDTGNLISDIKGGELSLEGAIKKYTEKIKTKMGSIDEYFTNQLKATGNKSISSFIEGKQTQISESVSTATQNAQKTIVEMTGGIKVDLNFTGLSPDFTPSQKEYMAKSLSETLNSQITKQYMLSVTTKQNPNKSNSQSIFAK